MVRRFAFLLAPRWLLLYVLVAVSTVAMVLLGRWQLQRAHEHHGNIQNYSYVLQWWAFSTFVVFMLVRVMRDALRERRKLLDPTWAAEPAAVQAEPEVAYRRYTRPVDAPSELDPMQLAYNDYLASLASPGEATKERRS
jgi:DNA-binding transcriptional regulator of glucitol operon